LRERDGLLARLRHLSTEVDDLTDANAAAESRRLQAARDAGARVDAAATARLEATRAAEGARERCALLEREVRELEAGSVLLAEQVARREEDMWQQARSNLTSHLTLTSHVFGALVGCVKASCWFTSAVVVLRGNVSGCKSKQSACTQAARMEAERAMHADKVAALEEAVKAAQRACEERIEAAAREATSLQAAAETQATLATSEAERLRSEARFH
jgi:hypothetical protein